MELLPMCVIRIVRLVAHRTHQQIEPLVTCEQPPGLDEAINVLRGKLDRADALDKERTVLSAEYVGVVVAENDLRPDASQQEPVVLAHEAVVDIDEVEVEVSEPRPVLVVGLDEPDRDLVDDLIGGVLLDR